MRRLALAALLLVAACSSPEPRQDSSPAGLIAGEAGRGRREAASRGSAPAPAAPAPASAPDTDEDSEAVRDERLLEKRLRENCTLCHALEIPLSQRVPAATWTKVLEKMTRWGANFRTGEAELLHANLVRVLPEDLPADPGRVLSGARLDAALASVERDAKADGPEGSGAASAGDAQRGASAFRATCASCHGIDARGGTTAGARGPNLLGLPTLWQSTFTTIVREGRNGMPGFAEATLSAQELVDLRAWLRAQADETTDPTGRTR